MIKEICSQLDIVGQCKKYRLPLWQCPSFVFLVMGIVIISVAIVTYVLGVRYVVDPNTVSIIVLAITVVLFVIAFSVTRSLEGLAEANQLKSEFISVVSHQLRSPLSNLKWALEVLGSKRFGNLEDKQLEYLRIIQENSRRMHELVSDLLMVSRINQGTLNFERKDFSLVDLVNEVIMEFKPLAEASNVKIELEAPNSLSKAFADPARIKVVVENLLDNAIRYIDGGGMVKILVSSTGNSLLFNIEDEGLGIPKEDQKYIFQKFFRSQNVSRYQTQGSGLGLNIAKSIIEKSGGKIWFRSEKDKGSTFYFTLPIFNK